MTDNRPVLIGVAQQTWREADTLRSPIDVMEQMARSAVADCGSDKVLDSIDMVATVPLLADQLPGLAELLPRNIGSALCDRMAIQAQCVSTHVGGNTPQQLLTYCADALAMGASKAVLLAGAEMIASLTAALQNGSDISAWQEQGRDAAIMLSEDRAGVSDIEEAHGLFEPILSYPLFESALRHANGWTEAEHKAQLGALISRMSEVAANNPYAWRQQRWTADEAISTANGNRMIYHPYTRVMNAILKVDMAAAVLMTTAGHARELGVDPKQMVYLRGAADASEIWHLTERPTLHQSPAIEAAAKEALRQAALAVEELDLFDIYSCFPSAVQVACDAIGIAIDDPRGVTLTGGLTLFGGPGNNYSLHGIVEMVRQLRAGRGRHGMVTANGYYLTKHAIGVYSVEPGPEPWSAEQRVDPQPALDRIVPVEVASQPEGEAVVEAFTAAYDKGLPVRGIVIGRLRDGRRFVAHTAADTELLQEMLKRELVGTRGIVTAGSPVNHFQPLSAD